MGRTFFKVCFYCNLLYSLILQNEEIEGWRGKMTWLDSHSQTVERRRLNPGLLSHRLMPIFPVLLKNNIPTVFKTLPFHLKIFAISTTL